MRVLLIGGAGLLGSYLAPMFASAGHEVALCDNFTGSIKYRISKEYRIFTANATDSNALSHAFSAFDPEVVVIGPAYHYSKDIIYKFQNDTKLILENANAIAPHLSRRVKQVVFCSSSEVYGGPQPRKSIKETRTIYQSSTHHGAAKLSAENFLSFRCYELGIPFACVRIFDMYGPRIVFCAKTGVVSFLIDAFLNNEVVGLAGATRKRDFVHVEDVSRAVLGLVDKSFSGVVNIGTGKGTTLKQLVSTVSKEIELIEPPIEIPDRNLPTFSAVADNSYLSSILKGWKPKHKLEKDIPKLVEFRKEEKDFYSRKNSQNVLNMTRSKSDG